VRGGGRGRGLLLELGQLRLELGHLGKPFAMHTLRNALADAQRDVGHTHNGHAATAAATVAAATDRTTNEVAQLKAQLAKLKEKAAAAATPAHKVNAVAVTPAEKTAAPKGSKRVNYNREEIGTLMDRGMCFKCGSTDHVKALCPSKVNIDLRPQLN
jgi:hypothetical protein